MKLVRKSLKVKKNVRENKIIHILPLSQEVFFSKVNVKYFSQKKFFSQSKN
jgi:hypothetical protein